MRHAHSMLTAGAALCAALTTLSVAHAAPLAPTAASQLVTVSGGTTECGPASSAKLFDQRLKGDGTTSPFIIPAKNVFVVTSFDFLFAGAVASQAITATLVVTDTGLTTAAAIAAPTVMSDSTGRGGGTLLLPSGFAVKSNTKICFQLSTGNTGVSGFLHGFFAKDK